MKQGKVFAEYPPNIGAEGMLIPLEGIAEEQQFLHSKEPLDITSVGTLGQGVFRDNLLKLGVYSTLIVPVIREGVWLGSFSLDAIGDVRVFSEADKNFCRAFAAQIAVAIHNSRQYQASEGRRQQLEALRRAILPIVTELDREVLLKSILQQAVILLGARSGGIYEYYPKLGQLQIIATLGNEWFRGKTLGLGEGIAGLLVRDRLSHMIINDYDNWSGKAPVFSNQKCFEAVLEVLLRRDENTPLGVLYVEASVDRPFRDDPDAELLKLFAEPAAVALVNSELHAQKNALLRIDKYRTQGLQRLSELAYSHERPEEVRFRVDVVQRALNLMDWKAGAMYLYNAKHHELQMVVDEGIGATLPNLTISEGCRLVGSAARQRACKMITRDSDSVEFESEFGAPGWQVAIAVPMHTYQELDSVLLLVHDQMDDQLLSAQKDILIRFANSVSNALQTRTLMDPARAQPDTHLLHLISGDVRTSDELDALLWDLLTLVTASFGLQFNRAVMFLLDEDRRSLVGRMGIGHVERADWEADCCGETAAGPFSFEDWIAMRRDGFRPDTPLGRWIQSVVIPLNADSPNRFYTVFESKNADVLPANRQSELPAPVQETLKPTTDIVLIPLIARNEFVGLLLVDNKFTRATVTRRDIFSLQVYSGVAALAVNQQELVQRTISTTGRLQETVASFSAISSAIANPTLVLRAISQETVEVFEATSVVVIANDELSRRRRSVFHRSRDAEQPASAITLDANSASVWIEGSPLLLEEVRGPNLPEGVRDGSVESAICLPLVFESQTLGVIWICYSNRKLPRFPMTGLLFYAGQVGVAYGNSKRLYELRKLHMAIQDMSIALRIREVEESIVRTAMETFQADSATLWPYDAKNRSFIEDEVVTLGLKMRPHLPGRGGLSEQLLDEPYYMAGPAPDGSGYPDQCTEDFLRHNDLKSFQGVALRAGGEAQGVLYVSYRELRDYGDSDREWLVNFANYAALSLRMARSLAQLRKALDAAEEVSSVIVSGNVNSTLESVAKTTHKAVRCNMVTLFRYDESRGTVDFPPTVFGDFLHPRRIADMDELDALRLVPMLINRRKTMIAQSEKQMRVFLSTRFGREEEVKSVVAVPLSFSGRAVGIMFASYRTPQSFTKQDLRAIQLFADQAAVAMGQAQRFEALTALSQELLAVSKEEAMKRVVAVAVDQLRVQFCVIALREGDRYRVREQFGWPLEYFCEDIEPEFGSHVGFTVLHRRPIVVADYRAVRSVAELRELNVPKRVLDVGIRSGMSVPVFQDGVVVCVMLVQTSKKREFTRQDVDFLSLVANQAVIAEESARRIGRERLSLEAFYAAAKVIIEHPEFDRRVALSEILRQAIKHMVMGQGKAKVFLGTLQLYDQNDDSLVFEIVEPQQSNPELLSMIGERKPAGIARSAAGPIGITGLALKTGNTIRIPNIATARDDIRAEYLVFSKRTVSELAVPLLDGAVPIGVINLESEDPDSFDEHDEKTVQILAELAVIAIKQCRIREEKEETQHRLESESRNFVARLAKTVHEIRTPIAPLRNEIHSLLEGYYGEVNDRQTLALERIQNSAEAQIRLVENMGYVVRIHEGQIKPTFESVDLYEILQEAVDVFRFRADRDGIALTLERIAFQPGSKPNLGPIRLDKRLIECVLRNLIENALRFNKKDGTVRVSPSRMTSEVVIEVADTGIGIPPAQLNKVFGLFYKVPEHSTTQVRGLGVGLSLCKTFVELHKGSITVESQEGSGSTFRIKLPLDPENTSNGRS